MDIYNPGNIVCEGINIYSGSNDTLGRALTNPTHYNPKNCKAVSICRGGLGEYDYLDHGIYYNEKKYLDVEHAYYENLPYSATNNAKIELIKKLIVLKLTQHSALIEAIRQRGSLPFLQKCVHVYKNVHPNSVIKGKTKDLWTSDGKDMFIQCLIKAYIEVQCRIAFG